MNKIVLGALAAAAIATPVMAAPTAQQAITINGTAPNVCTLAAPAVNGAISGNLTVSGSNVTVTGLFDTADATMDAGTVGLRFAGMCNYAHNVSLKSANGYLYNTTGSNAPLGGAFVRRVGYTAGFSWAGATVATAIPDATSTSSAGVQGTAVVSANTAVAGANAGNLDVTLSFASSGTTPVVAGNYSDTLTVQIGADL